MKEIRAQNAKCSFPPARRSARDSLLRLCLWALAAALPVAVLGQANYTMPYTFTTFAGNTGYGSADGTNGAAGFACPYKVKADSVGNLYVADTLNHTIRKATLAGTNWVVTTLGGLAGSPGTNEGTGSAARFNEPKDLAVDNAGIVYIADTANQTIRKVTAAGVVTTLAGRAGVSGSQNGWATNAQFSYPNGIAVDGAGTLYVSDYGNNAIRKMTSAGWVTTLAGVSGDGVALDSATNLYVADTDNHVIWKVTPGGVATVIAGQEGLWGTNDGPGSAARLNSPRGVAVDSATNVYVADTWNYTIRKLTPTGTTWEVATPLGLAGSLGHADGTNNAARFSYPSGVAVDSVGNLYVADSYNNVIRKVTPAGTDWAVTTLAGQATGGAGSADGTGSGALFNFPWGPAVDSAGNVYVADAGNDTIRKITPAGIVTTLAGKVGVVGAHDGTGTNAFFNSPFGPAVDGAGNVYVADWGNHTIRKVTTAGVVTTLAGKAGQPGLQNGPAASAQFSYPNGVAVDNATNVYVADTGNSLIRKITPAGAVATLASGFAGPTGVAVDTHGTLYVADFSGDTIWKVTPAGGSTVLAGLLNVPGSADGTNGTARFNSPYEVAVDSATNIYVADYGNHTIRKVTPFGTKWVVTTLAGLPGSVGSADGTGSAARFYEPAGVTLDSAGNLYVTDTFNSTIRKGFPASSVPPPVLQPPSLSAGQFGFGITGLPNLAVDIESSADLSQWQVVGAPVILAGGTNYFVSPNPSQGTQFYRAQVR